MPGRSRSSGRPKYQPLDLTQQATASASSSSTTQAHSSATGTGASGTPLPTPSSSSLATGTYNQPMQLFQSSAISQTCYSQALSNNLPAESAAIVASVPRNYSSGMFLVNTDSDVAGFTEEPHNPSPEWGNVWITNETKHVQAPQPKSNNVGYRWGNPEGAQVGDLLGISPEDDGLSSEGGSNSSISTNTKTIKHGDASSSLTTTNMPSSMSSLTLSMNLMDIDDYQQFQKVAGSGALPNMSEEQHGTNDSTSRDTPIVPARSTDQPKTAATASSNSEAGRTTSGQSSSRKSQAPKLSLEVLPNFARTMEANTVDWDVNNDERVLDCNRKSDQN